MLSRFAAIAVIVTLSVSTALAQSGSDESKEGPDGPGPQGPGEPRGPRGPHGRGPHGPPGPVGAVFKNLTQEQKDALKQLLDANRNSTKKEQKSAIDAFVQTLSPDLQEKVKKAEKNHEHHIEKIEEKIKNANLSTDALQLVEKIGAVLKNEDITRQQEHEQIKQLVKGADKKVLEELKKAHIPLPGIRKPHGPKRGHNGEPRHHPHHSTTPRA